MQADHQYDQNMQRTFLSGITAVPLPDWSNIESHYTIYNTRSKQVLKDKSGS